MPPAARATRPSSARRCSDCRKFSPQCPVRGKLIDTERWLAERLADVPASLRSKVEQAVRTHGPDLRRAADALLEEAKQGGADRDTALTLLAADALVTYVCEWMAETAPDRLGDLR